MCKTSSRVGCSRPGVGAVIHRLHLQLTWQGPNALECPILALGLKLAASNGLYGTAHVCSILFIKHGGF